MHVCMKTHTSSEAHLVRTWDQTLRNQELLLKKTREYSQERVSHGKAPQIQRAKNLRGPETGPEGVSLLTACVSSL